MSSLVRIRTFCQTLQHGPLRYRHIYLVLSSPEVSSKYLIQQKLKNNSKAALQTLWPANHVSIVIAAKYLFVVFMSRAPSVKR